MSIWLDLSSPWQVRACVVSVLHQVHTAGQLQAQDWAINESAEAIL